LISLLLDQGLPRSAAAILTSKGHDVLHVADLGLDEAKDMEIIQYARKQERTIVTLDADFHALLKVGGYSDPSVIRLRLEGLRGEELAELLEQVVSAVGNDLRNGALVTVNAKTIRIHRL
jgi:predicted nuclease of predicted toxin-antitoxin system